MFSYSIDIDMDEIELFLTDLAEAFGEYSQQNKSNEAQQIAEQVAALSMGDRLILPIEVDTGDLIADDAAQPSDAPRLALIFRRSGPSVFTLLVLSEDKDLLDEVTAMTRRLLMLRAQSPSEDETPLED